MSRGMASLSTTDRELACSQKSLQCAALAFSIVQVSSRRLVCISANTSMVLGKCRPSLRNSSTSHCCSPPRRVNHHLNLSFTVGSLPRLMYLSANPPIMSHVCCTVVASEVPRILMVALLDDQRLCRGRLVVFAIDFEKGQVSRRWTLNFRHNCTTKLLYASLPARCASHGGTGWKSAERRSVCASTWRVLAFGAYAKGTY